MGLLLPVAMIQASRFWYQRKANQRHRKREAQGNSLAHMIIKSSQKHYNKQYTVLLHMEATVCITVGVALALMCVIQTNLIRVR